MASVKNAAAAVVYSFDAGKSRDAQHKVCQLWCIRISVFSSLWKTAVSFRCSLARLITGSFLFVPYSFLFFCYNRERGGGGGDIGLLA